MKRLKVLTVFGTRPEVIKLAPLIHELERRAHAFENVNISSGQHADLLEPFIAQFQLRIDDDLAVPRRAGRPGDVARRVAYRLRAVLEAQAPDIVLVQGDTSTAAGAAECAHAMGIPVGHVEAGLRSGDVRQPFPEEIFRRRITRLASYHFAPTADNRRNLLREGVADSRIFVTGNTIVDALTMMLSTSAPASTIQRVIRETAGMRRIVLTMHRRENLSRCRHVFAALRRLVEAGEDMCILFPIHPNPAIRRAADAMRGHPRIRLLDPLDYSDFIHLVRHAWVVVTDSGGIQEEAPTLGKLVLLLRGKTERPEALATGRVKIIGDSAEALIEALADLRASSAVSDASRPCANPFGNGGSARAIADALESVRECIHESMETIELQATPGGAGSDAGVV